MLGRAPRPPPDAPARPPPLTRERVAGIGCEWSERHGVTILTRSDTDQAVLKAEAVMRQASTRSHFTPIVSAWSDGSGPM